MNDPRKRVYRDPKNRQAIVITAADQPNRNAAYIYPSIMPDGWSFVSLVWGHADVTYPTRREAIRALRQRMVTI